jgi:hypothetical protein
VALLSHVSIGTLSLVLRSIHPEVVRASTRGSLRPRLTLPAGGLTEEVVVGSGTGYTAAAALQPLPRSLSSGYFSILFFAEIFPVEYSSTGLGEWTGSATTVMSTSPRVPTSNLRIDCCKERMPPATALA